MRPRIQEVMVDSRDPAALARFWGEFLECPWAAVHAGFAIAETDQVRLAFQAVPERKQVKNRLHLDIEVDDADAAHARAVGLGALPAHDEHRDGDGDGFVVMRDPEGNEFCLVVDTSGAWERTAAEALRPGSG